MFAFPSVPPWFSYCIGRGAELERMIAEVRGGDEATVLRRLAEMLRVLRSDFKVAKQAAQMAGEAAAKCQVILRCSIELHISLSRMRSFVCHRWGWTKTCTKTRRGVSS